MQRPRRIAIFSTLCLLVGGIVLVHNLGQFTVALGGPDAVEVPKDSESQGQMGQVLRASAQALQAAMSDPVYRIGIGLKAVMSLLMAGCLIGAGIGLIRNQPWSLRLARLWGWYAIVSSIAVTILQTVYVVPNIELAQAPPGMAAAQYISMTVVLMLMCVFPVLLIWVLPSRSVTAYLNQQSTGQPVPKPASTPVAPASPHSTQTPPPSAQQPSARDQTWRDDPWNDPNSQ